ncbi:MAG: L,D-transpeptidase family protein [Pseudomonadota bacterium]
MNRMLRMLNRRATRPACACDAAPRAGGERRPRRHRARLASLFILMAPITAAGAAPPPDLWSAAAVDRYLLDRGNQPVWFDASGAARPALHHFVAFLRTLETHGLNAADYHLARLEDGVHAGEGQPISAAAQQEIDRLATDAFMTLSIHLGSGRAHPAVAGFGVASIEAASVLGMRLDEAIRTDTVAQTLTPQPLDPAVYARLQTSLNRLRQSTDFPAVPAGPTLRPGDRGPRVAALRRAMDAWERISAVELPAAETTRDAAEDVFDATLAERVRRFQVLTGLDADGNVGPQTVATLNIPRKTRIDQLIANLERQRWSTAQTADRLVRVNIPGFTLAALRNGKTVWETRVVVGRQYRPTPLLMGAIDTVVFNPTWTVPRRLVQEDLLPKIAADPAFLEKAGMTVSMRGDEGPITLDRAALKTLVDAGQPLPELRIRQAPGARNSLGRVKFLFPNHDQVYLHDTPSRQLFNRARRMYSSGCIRVEHPLSLAEFLMNQNAQWPRERMEALIETGKTKTIRIDPVPVEFVYWTAWPDAQTGELNLREDIYGNDETLARKLARTPWKQP